MSRHWKLSRLLLLSHVGLAVALGLVLLATGAAVIRAALLERAQAQATQVALEALGRMQDQQHDVAVAADLLQQRPTLQAQLRRGQDRAAHDFLEAFRRTAGLDGIQVLRNGELFASVGELPPQLQGQGLQQTGEDEFWWVQARPLPPPSGARLMVARRLSPQALAPAQPDVRLHLLPLSAATRQDPAAPDAPLTTAYRHVLATRQAEELRHQGNLAALRIEPVRDDSGDVRALLQASVPADVLARSGVRWLWGLLLGSALMALLAGMLAAWMARRIARPFADLALTARRLGVGDFETPVATPKTHLIEAQALARSLEQMRQQVRALTESERRQRNELDAVLDGVGDGIVAVDGNGCVRYANRQFLELVGRDESEVLGIAFEQVIPLATADGMSLPGTMIGALTDPLAVARRQGIAEGRVRARLGDRVRSLVVRSSAPPDGRQVAMIREESAAETARSMRDAILANLSHEFQTPLAAQLASIELLQDHLDAHPDAIAAGLVDAQYRGALRLSLLVDNLLDSVRLDSGEMRLRNDQVDLPALVDEAVDLMLPLLQQRSQQVERLLPQGDRRLRGDAQRLTQVLINLLANANKFAPDHSCIRVELVWGERTASLWVEDEGPGLPPLRRRADLFAPFRRAPDQEPSQRGTGLGLAIVRAMVERHGGEVVVAEPRHGHGARLGIVLPLEDA